MKKNEDYIQNEIGKTLSPKLKNMRYSKKGLPKAQRVGRSARVRTGFFNRARVKLFVATWVVFTGLMVIRHFFIPIKASEIFEFFVVFPCCLVVVQMLFLFFKDLTIAYMESDSLVEDFDTYGPNGPYGTWGSDRGSREAALIDWMGGKDN